MSEDSESSMSPLFNPLFNPGFGSKLGFRAIEVERSFKELSLQIETVIPSGNNLLPSTIATLRHRSDAVFACRRR